MAKITKDDVLGYLETGVYSLIFFIKRAKLY